MKYNKFLLLLFTVALCTCVRAQSDPPLRYFQFRVVCGHDNWQDTALVAATNDTTLIAQLQSELVKPLDERQFINGPIAHGDGGHNANASHRFAWHFVPNEWELVDLSIEVCSGCPYTDLDANPAYWVDNLGRFCPWSAHPVGEIEDPLTGTRAAPDQVLPVAVYPNPASTYLTIDLEYETHATIRLRDLMGRTQLWAPVFGIGNRVDVHHLPRGAYLVEIHASGGRRSVRQIFLQ